MLEELEVCHQGLESLHEHHFCKKWLNSERDKFDSQEEYNALK